MSLWDDRDEEHDEVFVDEDEELWEVREPRWAFREVEDVVEFDFEEVEGVERYFLEDLEEEGDFWLEVHIVG